MAELTPFGQSLQAQGGASALLRLQGYTPGTREYKRAYDVLYNLSTGRQKGTQKYEAIKSGVERRAIAGQRQEPARIQGYRPSRLAVRGYIRVSDQYEWRNRVSVAMPSGFDIPYFESLDDQQATIYVTLQFTGQFDNETGHDIEAGFTENYERNEYEPDLIVHDYWFE
jgi:hypothetical protein